VAIEADAAAVGLAVLGGFYPGPDDAAPQGTVTLLLLGPDGPRFWARFQASAEATDGAQYPLNRWSERVIGVLARRLGGTALFPFGGPPWSPFPAWARRTGRAWTSPVGLLVHDAHGLFVSYRGAVALPYRLEIRDVDGGRPCDACARPCLAACPAGALDGSGYDVPRCRDWIETGPGGDCLARGCAVRRACPVGATLRPEAQSAFHMAAFRANRGA
jgi:epoxyqueuosine reductase